MLAVFKNGSSPGSTDIFFWVFFHNIDVKLHLAKQVSGLEVSLLRKVTLCLEKEYRTIDFSFFALKKAALCCKGI